MRAFVPILILIATIVCSAEQAVAEVSTDSLLKVLDKTIERRVYYVGLKEGRIEEIRKETDEGYMTASERYALNRRLFEEYRSFSFDSAHHYVRLNIDLARRMGDRVKQAESMIDMSYTLLGGGLFLEAVHQLQEVDSLRNASSEELPVPLLVQYYSCREQTCLHMSRYTEGSSYSRGYDEAGLRYVDTLRSILPPDSGDKIALSRIYARDENRWRARGMLEELLAGTSFGTHEYAIIAATLYRACPEDMPQRVNYLILSALSDIYCAVKENESLRDLALVMYERGDITRAYNYSAVSMEDANFYNARLRRMEIAKIQPIIERANTMQIERQGKRLALLSTLLGVLAIILILAIVVIMRQVKALGKARRETLDSNEQLARLNSSLRESNMIKEQYIGQFMNLCSTYVNKLDRYREMVNSRIAGAKWEELRTMTASTDIIDREIRSFYDTFDRAFIDIYPDFVEQVNSLLRPEERIVLKKNELLNNELRIFALIRLGIHDSAGIATFLRYSANTVYTYRTKIRNKAIDKHSFEEQLVRMGL